MEYIDEFNKRWDSKKTLKDNLINIFSMKFIEYASSTTTGFYSVNQSEEKQAYDDIQQELLKEFQSSNVPLEAIYAHLLFMNKMNDKDGPIKQFTAQVKYVIQKIDELLPHLKADKKIQQAVTTEFRQSSRFR